MLTGDDAKFVIANRFVYKPHMELIQKVCERHNFIITVRETGKYSVERIEQGYPCKPHDVLEKSIKGSSLKDKDKVDETLRSAVISKVKQLQIYGFIGHWGKDDEGRKTLLGVRTITTHENNLPLLNQVGVEGTKAAAQNYPTQKTKNKYKTWISLDYLENELSGQVPQDTLTGDYDTHDIVYARASGVKRGTRVPSDSPDEKRFIDYINSAIFDGIKRLGYNINDSKLSETKRLDKKGLKLRRTNAKGYDGTTEQPNTVPDENTTKNPFSVIQHGPQQAYVAHILAEGKEFLVPGLIAYDLPIAVFGNLDNFGQQGPIVIGLKKIERVVITNTNIDAIIKDKDNDEDQLDRLYDKLGGQGWKLQVKTFENTLPYLRTNMGVIARKEHERKRRRVTSLPPTENSTEQQKRKKDLKAIDDEWTMRLNAWDWWIIKVLRGNSDNLQQIIEKPDDNRLLTSEIPIDRGSRLQPNKKAMKWVIDSFVEKGIEFYEKRLQKRLEKLLRRREDLDKRRPITNSSIEAVDREIGQIHTKQYQLRALRSQSNTFKNNLSTYQAPQTLSVSLAVPSDLVEQETVLINGQKVIFDKAVATTPVALETKTHRRPAYTNGNGHRRY